MYKTSKLLKLIYPELLWSVQTRSKELFLTFDDGPVPGVTDFVLEELDKFKAKATFFCVGDNVAKHPEVFRRIVHSGQMVGNHTYNHLNGWKTDNTEYFENIQKCERIMAEHFPEKGDRLFRPPYGRIKKSQIKHLKNQFQIVMWDVLTKDYDLKKTEVHSLKKSIGGTEPGSVVVFHDRYKNESNLKYMLPLFLSHFSEQGFTFKTIGEATNFTMRP